MLAKTRTSSIMREEVYMYVTSLPSILKSFFYVVRKLFFSCLIVHGVMSSLSHCKVFIPSIVCSHGASIAEELLLRQHGYKSREDLHKDQNLKFSFLYFPFSFQLIFLFYFIFK